MLKGTTTKPRFYQRATVSNDPMSVRQIKEAAMRTEGAIERAEKRILERVAAWEHVSPLGHAP
jgi:hypothetical protein